jgi:hypothetical protein
MNPYLYISLFRRQRLNALTSAAPMAGGNTIISAFITRIVADGGTFEGDQKCFAVNLQFLIS